MGWVGKGEQRMNDIQVQEDYLEHMASPKFRRRDQF